MQISPYKYPMNFAKVDETLYRSSQPNVIEIKYMKSELGLTDIFNLSDNSPKTATEAEIKTAKNLGINYHSIPSRTESPIWEKIKSFVDSVNMLKSQNNKKVLAHCNAGVDRTGTYVLFYQLINRLKTYDEAVKEMIEMGHNPKDLPKLLPRIQEIAKKMKFIK